MKIILVRHGETEENKKKISQGWMNTRLSKIGLYQARKVAVFLKNEKIDVCYSSDLSRASETAEEILRFHDNTQLILDKRLREQDKGIHEGQPFRDSQKEIDKLGIEWHEYKPENGESYDELLVRVCNIFKEIGEEHIGKTCLIVTHGGCLSCLLCYLHNEPLSNIRKYSHGNAGVTYLELSKNGKWRVTKLNCTEHLK